MTKEPLTPCIYCGKNSGECVKAKDGGTICISCLRDLEEMGREDHRQFKRMEKKQSEGSPEEVN